MKFQPREAVTGEHAAAGIARVPSRGRPRLWLRRGVPWLVAGALLAYLFAASDWREVVTALNRVNFVLFFLVVLSYVCVHFIVDCLGTAYTLRQFKLGVPLGQVLAARGVSFLLAVVSYPVGQGALPVYLHRTQRLPLWATSGTILLLTFVDFFWVVLLSFLGSLVIARSAAAPGLAVADYVWQMDLVFVVTLLLFLFFWLVIIPHAGFFGQPVRRALTWIGHRPLFAAFRQAGLRTYWQIALVRVPVHLSVIFFSWLALRAFTPSVPFAAFVFVYPLALLVGVLPITPGGLGTMQVVVVEFLSGFAAREVLLAFSVLWMLSVMALRVLVGVYYLRRRFAEAEARGI